MAKLKVVARVTRRAKEQASKLGLTVCAAGKSSASCLPASSCMEEVEGKYFLPESP